MARKNNRVQTEGVVNTIDPREIITRKSTFVRVGICMIVRLCVTPRVLVSLFKTNRAVYHSLHVLLPPPSPNAFASVLDCLFCCECLGVGVRGWNVMASVFDGFRRRLSHPTSSVVWEYLMIVNILQLTNRDWCLGLS